MIYLINYSLLYRVSLEWLHRLLLTFLALLWDGGDY